MLTPNMLERASAHYRRGYYDGYYGEPMPKGVMPPDYSFAAKDYNDGYAAGANDRRWDRADRKRTADRIDGYDRDDLGESPDF